MLELGLDKVPPTNIFLYTLLAAVAALPFVISENPLAGSLTSGTHSNCCAISVHEDGRLLATTDGCSEKRSALRLGCKLTDGANDGPSDGAKDMIGGVGTRVSMGSCMRLGLELGCVERVGESVGLPGCSHAT